MYRRALSMLRPISLPFLALLVMPAPARADCPVPSSFSGSYQVRPSGNLFAFTVATPAVRNGRIAVTQNTRTSWVNRGRVTLGNQRSGTTAQVVRACQQNFRGNNTFFIWRPNPTCPAGAALASERRANSAGECESVIGRGLDEIGARDTERLLRHEQYHVKLTCAVAEAGNAKIAGGARAATVLNQVRTAIQRQQVAYDRESNHGCIADRQASWQSRIDSLSTRWLP